MREYKRPKLKQPDKISYLERLACTLQQIGLSIFDHYPKKQLFPTLKTKKLIPLNFTYKFNGL